MKESLRLHIKLRNIAVKVSHGPDVLKVAGLAGLDCTFSSSTNPKKQRSLQQRSNDNQPICERFVKTSCHKEGEREGDEIMSSSVVTLGEVK